MTHTNDLVALSISHSALHRLAIPHIYSRFDIVWPDSTAQSEPRTGVDALTYGLATLVMAEEVFGESPSQRPATCKNCGHCPDEDPSTPTGIIRQKTKKRRGNYYAEFTRKFSLGNGPVDWIKEYLVNTESGKMLGTLVALAIARMRSLENFIWDMPTGILPDVWNALASLGEREGGSSCRLERVWVRWHNNSHLVEGDYLGRPIPHDPHTFWQTQEDIVRDRGEPSKLAAVHKRNKVERPTFSSLPPLKGLSVLDIDECSYLDEMSMLVSESIQSLRELRIGIASQAVSFNWNYPSLESETSQAAQGKSRFTGNISVLEKRLGGVLGVLTSYIFDLKKERAHNVPSVREKESESPVKPMTSDEKAESPNDLTGGPIQLPIGTPSQRSRASFVEDLPPYRDTSRAALHEEKDVDSSRLECARIVSSSSIHKTHKLQLEVLAMERVSLSVPILAGAFDWTTLTDLTLLDCQFSATFFSFLRRQYTPASDPQETSKPINSGCFRLKLRKIHINTVTPASVAFMRETLAPNTLEILFMQQSEYHLSKVSADKIMGVVKRHKGSLRKVLIDSSERDETDYGSPRAVGWDRWLFNRSMLAFVTSGKMPKLRELGIAISYKDWVSHSRLGCILFETIANPTSSITCCNASFMPLSCERSTYRTLPSPALRLYPAKTLRSLLFRFLTFSPYGLTSNYAIWPLQANVSRSSKAGSSLLICSWRMILEAHSTACLALSTPTRKRSMTTMRRRKTRTTMTKQAAMTGQTRRQMLMRTRRARLQRARVPRRRKARQKTRHVHE